MRRQSPTAPRAMLLTLLAAVAALLLATALPAAAQGGRLRSLSGEELTDSDLDRGTIIVVVWASWSPRGRDIDRRVNALVSRWGNRARVITVNFQEDRPTVEEFLAGKNLRAPVFLDPDGSFSKKHAVTTLPGLLVIQNGKSAYRGKLPDDPDSVISEILG